MLKEADTRRNYDGSYRRITGEMDQDSYATVEHGIEERVDERHAAVFSGWFNAEVLAAQRARNVVLQAHNERVIGKAVALPGGQQTTLGTPWTDPTSDPVADVRDAAIKIRNRVGMVMNLTLTIEWEILQHLKDNNNIIDRLKYAGFRDPERSNITVAALEDIFDIDRLLVSRSVRITEDEPIAGQPTFGKSWNPDYALLSVTNSGGSLTEPQYMRTFHWSADGSTIGGTVESYGENWRRSDIVRVRMDTDEKIVYTEAAQLLSGVAP